MVVNIRSFTSGRQPPQPVPALVHFLKQSDLSKEEIEELKKILEREGK